MNRSRLIVVRHGHTAWSQSGQHTGRTDLGLLPEGEDAARGLEQRLRAAGPFGAVWTSPLRRARDTARLAGYPAAEADDDLVEWHYGADEGRTSVDIRIERPGWDSWSDGYAGDAEPIAAVARRADAMIERARAADATVLAFAHGHLLSIVAARWIGLPPERGASFVLHPAGIGVLGSKYVHPTIERWNA